ncbi:hypothetical protein [Thalassotalea sp. PLHSN55]|uniref:hypothetical protein n=1 Tax=Thalassotalea sp. PLHSN55 TaxID=3435888 RepID=UPI003F836314
MPTPNIYSKLQVYLSPFGNIFLVLSLILVAVGILGFYLVPEGGIEPEDSWKIYVPMLLCWLAAMLLWCIGVSRFQMESFIRKIPLLGKLHKLMVSDSKPWAEAMYLNFILLLLFVYLAGGFSVFG